MIKTKDRFHQYAWVLLIAFCSIGLIYPAIGAVALVCMLAPVLWGFFQGRMWCGNFCPRGSFSDVILKKFSQKKPVPKFIKSGWFRNLFLFLLMSAFALQLVLSWGNAFATGAVFVRMIIITTMLTIVLDITFSHRTWCRICPMGNLAHYAAKTKTLKSNLRQITFDADKCIGCKVCSKNCPMGIDLLSHKSQGKVLDANCLKCKVCVEKCPRNSLYVS
ncbi:4Fe-4S binding protein [Candidatus Formimonas warabiya]|uniref:4Fe-4S ferredoxin n=1 Tax=Formimonas warabiya TaxID=1761012 RepID=A0A3G1KRZ6_FORW1|nr:4Fe-4S binding protein [Candidatus Formimonas warabiya]ATW25228.1 4Fe-4S ferredoxin [Candidatus Formimonas warabiya]